MKITATIPATPFIIKFLSIKLDIDLREKVYNLEEVSMWGTLICQMMNKTVIDSNNNLMKKDIRDKIKLAIPPQQLHLGYFHWTEKHTSKLNSFLKKIMYQELFILLEAGNNKKGDIKKIIYSYMQYYGFDEEEIKYDALIKAYYRSRKKKKKSIKNVLINVR
jgi:hypothetical protein